AFDPASLFVSIDLNPTRFDRTRPFVDLARNELAQILGGAALGWHHAWRRPFFRTPICSRLSAPKSPDPALKPQGARGEGRKKKNRCPSQGAAAVEFHRN